MHRTKHRAALAATVLAAVTATALPAAVAAPAAPRTEGVSVTPAGKAGNDTSAHAVISRDGRYAAFDSEASDLVAADTGGLSDIFVRDLRTGRTERIALAGRRLRSPSLSADGRYVAMITSPADSYSGRDVRLYDRRTKKTERLDVELPDGYPGDSAGSVSLSANARYAVFDTDGPQYDGTAVFLRDRKTGTTERISHPYTGGDGERDAHSPTVSDDGRRVAYATSFTNGPRGDDWSDLWLRDRRTGKVTQVDRSHDGSRTEKESLRPALSGDGRTVVFESRDTHLVPNDDDAAWNVFVHDLASGANQRVHGTQGGPGEAYTRAPAISADGRYLTYMSELSEPGSQWGKEWPVYLRDLKRGTTTLVTPDTTGGAATADVGPGGISADGRKVAFLSGDPALLSGDTNDGDDAFVRHVR
ncbi:PD40 domain-containing protein [Streptomyces sp. NRRL S-920]|uniref:PD40 domain-containing protein n=1 Tax=Streptomyces sp. NRRL S-920 TaxID=1463921 RepID=UPI0004C613F4|nr:PD40 domain-containing protein [Streptomyces sp. NRRL S-920]